MKRQCILVLPRTIHEDVTEYRCDKGTLVGDRDGDLSFFKLQNQDDIIAVQPTLNFGKKRKFLQNATPTLFTIQMCQKIRIGW